MANLQIQNLPEPLYQSIQKLAETKNVSLNDAVIQMLAWASSAEPVQQLTELERTKEALAKIRNFPRKNPADSGLPDSTLLIREDRDR